MITSGSTEAIQCGDPFHIDGCPGAVGGDHELRPVYEVWCDVCDQPAVFASRLGGTIVPLCALHGLEQAQAIAHSAALLPLGGIEQYQAEGR